MNLAEALYSIVWGSLSTEFGETAPSESKKREIGESILKTQHFKFVTRLVAFPRLAKFKS